MKRFMSFLLMMSLLIYVFSFTSLAEEDVATEEVVTITPVPFIIDTDFSTDVDDVLAISTACYFDDLGLIDIRGVALCCTSTNGAYAMSALLRKHGKSDVPIACDWDDGIPMGSKYHRTLMEYGYNESYYVDTVSFYRMLLASSTEKVTIVTTGQLTNIYMLLQSGPDIHSTLTGTELVSEKVESIYIVGGKSNGKLENNIWYSGENLSTNRWYNGGAGIAAKYVADNCPVSITWMEADIIGTFTVGDFLCRTDKNDILSKSLIAYGTDYGSASFDPFGVTIAVLDSNGLLEEVLNISKISGKMGINAGAGTSYFVDSEYGTQYRIQKNEADGFYKSYINQTLAYEFHKRSDKDIKW